LIGWERLTPEGFESLCYDVLADLDFKNLDWLGRTGGDRGRDIRGYKTETITETKEFRRLYLVQCKKYRPSVTDLYSTLAWADAYDPNVLMIMVSDTLTAGTHDWIEEMKQKKKYGVLVFEDKDFEHFFDSHRETYAKHFGEVRTVPKLAVILSLLDDQIMDIETIARSAGLSEAEVGNVIEELRNQSIILSQPSDLGNRYQLQHTISALTNIAALFLEEKQKFDFLSSQFLKSMNGPALIEYIELRYHLILEDTHKEALTKLFAISPSALHAAIFSPTGIYDTGYAHIRELNLSEVSQKEMAHQFLTLFVSMLLEEAIKDLRDPSSKEALKANAIEGYNIAVKIIMANPTNTVLNLHSATTIMMLPVQPGSTIKAGQLVGATSPDLFIRTGNTLLNLEVFDKAIRDYDRALAGLTDKKQLAIVWNNKGVCFLRLKRNYEAVKCFQEALHNDPSLDKARANLENCKKPPFPKDSSSDLN